MWCPFHEVDPLLTASRPQVRLHWRAPGLIQPRIVAFQGWRTFLGYRHAFFLPPFGFPDYVYVDTLVAVHGDIDDAVSPPNMVSADGCSVYRLRSAAFAACTLERPTWELHPSLAFPFLLPANREGLLAHPLEDQAILAALGHSENAG